MGIAVLQFTGRLVVAVVTVHDQHAEQALRAQDLLSHLAGAGLPEAKKTDLRGAKQPRVTVASVRSPAGFIRMLDRRLAKLLEQLVAGGFQTIGQLLQRTVQGAATDSELYFQGAERDAEDVVLHGHVGQQPVAEQMAFENSRRARPHGSSTAATVFLLQVVKN